MTHHVIEHNGVELGRRIRTARKEARITIRALAAALDVDVRTVNRWQSGDSTPSIETLYGIARVLGKTPAYFLEAA